MSPEALSRINSAARKVPTMADIMLALLLEGMEAAYALAVMRKHPRLALRDTVATLRAQDHHDLADKLQAFTDVHEPGAPGARLPMVGETRKYVASESHESPIARVPLNVLGIQPGGFARVIVEQDALVIVRAP